MRMFYAVIYTIIWPFFNLVHPHRAIGREHIPEGGVLVCGNHTSLSDPLFLAFAFHKKYQLRPMGQGGAPAGTVYRMDFKAGRRVRRGTGQIRRGRHQAGHEISERGREGPPLPGGDPGPRQPRRGERTQNRGGHAGGAVRRPHSPCVCAGKKALVWTDAPWLSASPICLMWSPARERRRSMRPSRPTLMARIRALEVPDDMRLELARSAGFCYGVPAGGGAG